MISDTDAVCLYGLDIIAEQMSQGRMYYMHDGLGSVRQLTDHTGQIADSYAYDPLGVPLSGGTVPNPYRFTGEAWDAEVELLYLRARYYHPATGRFVTQDPWPGDVWGPGTLNRYLYVGNNPVNMVDPTGLQCVGPLCGPQPSGPPSPATIPPGPPSGALATGTPIPPGGAPAGTAGPTPPPQPSPPPTPIGTPHPCEVPTAPPMPLPAPPISFEHWKWHFWPDPFRGAPPGLRARLMVKATAMYLNQAQDVWGCALSKQNNPLEEGKLIWQLIPMTIFNRLEPGFERFLDTLTMDRMWDYNYEPYFLTLLTRHHPRDLEEAQEAEYLIWLDHQDYSFAQPLLEEVYDLQYFRYWEYFGYQE